MTDVLTRMAVSSLEYWLRRIRLAAAQAPSDDPNVAVTNLITEHYERLWRLLSQAAAFPDAQAKAAELALVLDGVMQAQAYHQRWLPVVRGLAVALDNGMADDPLTVAQLWRSTARCYLQLGDQSRAARAFLNAEHLTGKGDQGEAGMDLDMELRQEKGGVRALQMRFEEAEKIAHQLLEDARACGDIYTEAHGRTLLAFSYLLSHRLVPAYNQAQQALVLWKRLDNAKGQARALHYMGEACRLNNRLSRARIYLGATHTLLRSFWEEPWQAHLEQSFGALALDEGHVDEALERLFSARVFFEHLGDERNKTSSAHALGVAFTRAGFYEEAEVMLREALDGWERLGSSLEVANVRHALGHLYRHNGQQARARQTLQDALQAARSLPQSEYRDRLLREIDQDLAAL